MGNKAKMYVDVMALHPEVTGSCFLCVARFPDKSTVRFLVDCGLFQEEEYSNFNMDFPFKAEELSFVLVTHNHVDHIGRIPMLYNLGYRGKVYCSKQTKIFLPLALNDSQKVLKDVCKRQHIKNLYTEANVDMATNSTIGLNYDETISITPNISIRLLKNGHLIGAAMILITLSYGEEEPVNILFTGDYNSKNVFIDNINLPEDVKETRLSIITESTYGNIESNQIRFEFDNRLLDAIKENKTIITPVFSLGRSQEILLRLKQLQDAELLDANIPIYFDGRLAHNYTSLYLKNDQILEESKKDFLPENIKLVDCETRNDLLNCDNCKIIVTTSGMGTYGPAQVYIPYFISKNNALILFTGYTAEGTFGAKLKNANKGEVVNLGGLVGVKRAEVAYCTEFSAHAKADELINLLKQFRQARAILVNHGQTETKGKFAERIVEEIDPPAVGLLDRQYFFRIDTWGINKTLSTKFK